MKQEALSYFTDVEYTLAALAIFMCCFSAFTAWVFRKNGKLHYDKMSNFPIGDDHES